MTQQEAINILDRRTTIPGDGFTWEQINEAIDMAIAALTPIRQEQVEKALEKAWKGEWLMVSDGSGVCSECNRLDKIDPLAKFCRYCGAPMTDKAVQMVMERLEALRGETETD